MSLSKVFTKNLPSLDLHGESKDTAVLMVSDFINDNLKLKNEYILVIHGIGTGILKNAIHDFLKKDKRVLEYQVDFMNIGSTIIKIRI